MRSTVLSVFSLVAVVGAPVAARGQALRSAAPGHRPCLAFESVVGIAGQAAASRGPHPDERAASFRAATAVGPRLQIGWGLELATSAVAVATASGRDLTPELGGEVSLRRSLRRVQVGAHLAVLRVLGTTAGHPEGYRPPSTVGGRVVPGMSVALGDTPLVMRVDMEVAARSRSALGRLGMVLGISVSGHRVHASTAGPHDVSAAGGSRDPADARRPGAWCR